MKIALIILNYNKKELLAKCLDSVNNLKYNDDLEIIVVDNGSKDGSIELVKENFKRITLLEVGYNSGFCKGNNIGIKHALSNGCDGIVVLNNDTEVEPSFLQGIIKVLDPEKKIGMVSTNIILFEPRNIIDANGFMITPDGLGKNLNAGKFVGAGEIQREVFCPTGAATFYSKELLKDIEQDGQYYDEYFEFCYEELDLGWRARLLGWSCVYAPEAVVYHRKSATGGTYSGFFAYYSNRNIFYNIIKNYPSRGLVLRALLLSFLRYVFLFFGLFMGKGVGNKIKNKAGLFSTIKVFFRSTRDAFKNMPKMLEKRKYIQERKKVDNQEIKRWFKELGFSFFNSIYKL